MTNDFGGPVRQWVQTSSTSPGPVGFAGTEDGGRAGPPLFSLTIHRCLPSWNEIYVGVHWRKRKQIRDLWHDLVIYALQNQPQEKIPANAYPLHMVVDCYRRKRLFDCSNLCIKVAEDALIERVIPNDSPRFISGITLFSRKGQDRTTIKLFKQEASP